MPPVPEASWWALHVVQDVALTASMALAFAGSRRVGAHSPYGQMLFLLAVGFWFLLLGEFAFVARNALGTWRGPGGLPDALSLPGWTLLVASVTFFVVQFRPTSHGGPPLRLALWVLGALVLLGTVFYGWVSPPGADPDAPVRAAYLAVDAVGAGVLLAGIDRLHRLRRSALGRLYVLLSAAILVKTVGDLLWAYLAARDAGSIVATAFYPVAGALALTGLVLHHRDLRGEALDGVPLGTPWMHAHQLYLRDAAHRLREVAGGYASRTYLQAAAGAFERASVGWTVREGVLEADGGTPAQWAEAVERADAFASRHFGHGARHALRALRPPPEVTA